MCRNTTLVKSTFWTAPAPVCGTFSELHGYVSLLPPLMMPAAVTHARRVWRWVARVGAIPMVMDAESVWVARTHQRGAYGWWTIAGDHT